MSVRKFVTAAVAAVALVSGFAAQAPAGPIAHAAAATLSGKYGCTVVLGQTTTAYDAGLTLNTKGHYRLAFYGVNGGSTSGSYKKIGTTVLFRGGGLDGKTGTRKAHPISGASVQIAFKSWLRGERNHSCLKS